MSRTWSLMIAACAALALLAACTPGEPEFSPEDRMRAGERPADEPAEGEDGEPAEPGEAVVFTAVDIDFAEDEQSAPAGTLTFELTNEGQIFHNVVIEELGDQVVVEADPGETQQGNVTLDAGTYTYFCSVPGHRAAGMEGTLTVS